MQESACVWSDWTAHVAQIVHTGHVVAMKMRPPFGVPAGESRPPRHDCVGGRLDASSIVRMRMRETMQWTGCPRHHASRERCATARLWRGGCFSGRGCHLERDSEHQCAHGRRCRGHLSIQSHVQLGHHHRRYPQPAEHSPLLPVRGRQGRGRLAGVSDRRPVD
jgi:hypothetical protein